MNAKSSLPMRVNEWWNIVRRHWLLESIVAGVIFAGAIVYIKNMPDVYKAETRILVNPQTVSNKYVNSAVSMDSTERLNTLSQQVLSSSRLQVILDDMRLFPKLRRKLGREQLIDLMRHRIGIELKQSIDGPSSFTLSYTGDSAVEVAEVTNRLAQSFIQWNLHDREEEAQSTTQFLSAELQNTKTQLDGFEEQLRIYKLQHLGELPGQLEANMQALTRLQLQLQANVDSQNRLDQEAFLVNAEEPVPNPSGGVSVPNQTRQQLMARSLQAHRELAELQKQYTDAFPDVVAKQKEVKSLDLQIQASPPMLPTDQRKTDLTMGGDPKQQIIARNRVRLANEQRQIEASIGAYQGKVNASPIREQEIAQLLRDYDTAKEHYRSLLEKTYSAQMAAELERKQQGGSFTMLDAARIPDAPTGPDRGALYFGALLFSLAAAIGVALFREMMDSTIKSEESLRSALPEMSLLALVPSLSTPRPIRISHSHRKAGPRSRS